jgi:hypothetical protein
MLVKKVFGSLFGILATLAVVVGNLDSIQNYVSSHFFKPKMPTISVNLFNRSDKDVGILTRGEFIVFFPGLNYRCIVGKYELEPDLSDTLLRAEDLMGVVAVRANKGVLLRMRIMNGEEFAKLLDQGDCEVTFMFRYQNGDYVPESNLRNDSRPFTRNALKKRLLVDVGLNK